MSVVTIKKIKTILTRYWGYLAVGITFCLGMGQVVLLLWMIQAVARALANNTNFTSAELLIGAWLLDFCLSVVFPACVIGDQASKINRLKKEKEKLTIKKDKVKDND